MEGGLNKEISEVSEISTLEMSEIYKVRGCGNTTRQVNFAVNCLFRGFQVKVEDHYRDRKADLLLLNRIEKRLTTEHPNQSYNVDLKKLIISFNKLK